MQVIFGNRAMSTEDQKTNLALIKNLNEEIVELDYPLSVGEAHIREIAVRKPTIKALSGVSLKDLFNYDVNALARVLPRITTPSLTSQQVYELDPSDFAQLGGQVINFLYPKKVQEQIQEMMEE